MNAQEVKVMFCQRRSMHPTEMHWLACKDREHFSRSLSNFLAKVDELGNAGAAAEALRGDPDYRRP